MRGCEQNGRAEDCERRDSNPPAELSALLHARPAPPHRDWKGAPHRSGLHVYGFLLPAFVSSQITCLSTHFSDAEPRSIPPKPFVLIRGEGVDVAARAECIAAGAGRDHHPHIVVGAAFLSAISQRARHLTSRALYYSCRLSVMRATQSRTSWIMLPGSLTTTSSVRVI